MQNLINQIEEIDNRIADLMKHIDGRIKALKDEKSKIEKELNEAVIQEASEKLKSKNYGCGTVNIEEGDFKIKVTVSKKVKWDNEKLSDIEELIRKGGQNPENFIKCTRTVNENSYKDFTDDIKKVFEPARTVEPSKPKITIERKVD